MPLTQSQRTQALTEQHELWNQVRQASLSQIGPVKSLIPSSPEIDLNKFETTNNTLDLVNDLTASPFVDYQFDGAKTSAVIADSLYNELSKQKGLENIEIDIQTVVAALLEQLHAPDVSFALNEVNERAQWWVPDGLDGWLRLQRIRPQETTPLTSFPSYPSADARFPFVVYRREQDDFALNEHRAYWCNRGLNAQFNQDANLMQDESQWDSERLQVTFHRPYLLLCNGILRGHEWGHSIVDRLQREAVLNPVVVIIADGIAEGTPLFEDHFVSIILPAPHDQEIGEGEFRPRRPVMQRMAEIFSAEVMNLWVEPTGKKEPEWEAMGDALGRCEVAQIDRHRTVLVEMHPSSGQPLPDSSKSDEWFPLTLHTLTLPIQTSEALAKAEMLLRKRVEAEDGVVAGGCAVLYWLADHINADTQITPWVREALRAPMRHILKNAGIDIQDDRGQRIAAWVKDSPTHTFFIDVKGEWASKDHPFEIVNNVYPVLLGDARDLGIINPRTQIARIIQESLRAAFELAVLYVDFQEQ